MNGLNAPSQWRSRGGGAQVCMPRDSDMNLLGQYYLTFVKNLNIQECWEIITGRGYIWVPPINLVIPPPPWGLIYNFNIFKVHIMHYFKCSMYLGIDCLVGGGVFFAYH